MEEVKATLNVNQVRAIDLLMQGMTQKAVADTVGMNQKTISRWTDEPEFAAELERRKDELAQAMEMQLASSAQEALARLRELVGSENDSVALQACRIMLTSAARATERRSPFDRAMEDLAHSALARAQEGGAQ